mmetsp:Transcript_11554/g.32056  ORF Transcript_11554/g.32056 Transcript_11554/m.32056 type:complete len:307 (+) Transcript_11554:722-1642(+)
MDFLLLYAQDFLDLDLLDLILLVGLNISRKTQESLVLRLDRGERLPLLVEELLPVALHLLPLGNLLLVRPALEALVLFLELLGELLQVLHQLGLLLLPQLHLLPWPPQELEEAIPVHLVKLLAQEGPHDVPVLHLVHRGDRGSHVPSGGIPIHVGAHEVLVDCHGVHVIDVEELELPVEALETSDDEELSLRGPVQRGDRPSVKGSEVLDLLGVLHGVEADVGPRAVPVDHREPVALWLPGERDNLLLLVLQLENLHGDVPLLHPEELKAVVRALLGLGEPRDLEGQVASIGVPVNRHVLHAKQVL